MLQKVWYFSNQFAIWVSYLIIFMVQQNYMICMYFSYFSKTVLLREIFAFNIEWSESPGVILYTISRILRHFCGNNKIWDIAQSLGDFDEQTEFRLHSKDLSAKSETIWYVGVSQTSAISGMENSAERFEEGRWTRGIAYPWTNIIFHTECTRSNALGAA